MSVTTDISALQNLCMTSARCTLDQLLDLGPKPDDTVRALLWEQQTTRLQGQLNSLTAMNSKLAAASILTSLKKQTDALAKVGQVSRDAEKKIKQIAKVSDLLITLSKVLDLGLAVLTAAAGPTAASLTAVLDASTALSGSIANNGT